MQLIKRFPLTKAHLKWCLGGSGEINQQGNHVYFHCRLVSQNTWGLKFHHNSKPLKVPKNITVNKKHHHEQFWCTRRHSHSFTTNKHWPLWFGCFSHSHLENSLHNSKVTMVQIDSTFFQHLKVRSTHLPTPPTHWRNFHQAKGGCVCVNGKEDSERMVLLRTMNF